MTFLGQDISIVKFIIIVLYSSWPGCPLPYRGCPTSCLRWLSCPDYLVLAVLTSVLCRCKLVVRRYLFLAVMSPLFCCDFLSLLFCHACPRLAVLSRLFCHGYHIMDVLLSHSRHRCPVLASLPRQPLCLSFNSFHLINFLSMLSCQALPSWFSSA